MRPSRALAIAFVWLVAIGLGFTSLWRFSYTPGPPATAPAQWPAGLARDASAYTLVVVLHPDCACSNATLGELAKIMARATAPLHTLVLFTDQGDRDRITGGTLWQSAVAIPGVNPMVDRNGTATRRFGAFVSGQTYLFDRAGGLIFNGGITAARGHAGDNDGETAVLDALVSGQAPVTTTPVFGCLLLGSTAS
jgi:hypothetical protein